MVCVLNYFQSETSKTEEDGVTRFQKPTLRLCLYGMISTLLVLSFLVGCAGVQRRGDPPRVTLADIRMGEARTLETEFQVDLRVFNGNNYPLRVNGLQCDLEVNGRTFASGVSKDAKEIGALSTDTVTVTAYSSMLSVAAVVMDMIKGSKTSGSVPKELEYALKGKLWVGASGMGSSPLPFVSEGVLSFDK